MPALMVWLGRGKGEDEGRFGSLACVTGGGSSGAAAVAAVA
jgi:hypothetical protein